MCSSTLLDCYNLEDSWLVNMVLLTIVLAQHDLSSSFAMTIRLKKKKILD